MTLNSQTHILEAAQLKPLLTPTPRDIKCFRTWNITTDHQGKQCQGRPKSNLKRPCSQSRTRNMTWKDAIRVAQDHREWRQFGDDLCLPEGSWE